MFTHVHTYSLPSTQKTRQLTEASSARPQDISDGTKYIMMLTCTRCHNRAGQPICPGSGIRPQVPLGTRPSASNNVAWILSSAPKRASPLAATTDGKQIENLDRTYCDDFVCTSSPAVEQSVRSFARGLELLRMPPSLFARDVEYSDGLRSFKGSGKYARLRWIADSVSKPSVVGGAVMVMAIMHSCLHGGSPWLGRGDMDSVSRPTVAQHMNSLVHGGSSALYTDKQHAIAMPDTPVCATKVVPPPR